MSTGESKMKSPVEVYYSYAPTERDEELRLELEHHLKILEHAGLIAGWHRGEIRAGSVHAQERSAHLEQAQLILLLISPDFLASQEAYGIEMRHALARQARGEAHVIPILLRPVLYEGAPFAHLEMLPSNGKPITSWAHRDEAFENVARGINLVLGRLSEDQTRDPSAQHTTAPSMPPPGSRYETHVHGPVQGLVIGEHNTVTTFFNTGQTPQTTSPSSGQVRSCDVLLVTATQVETQAVLSACQQETGHPFTRQFLEEGVYYDLQAISGARTFLVQSEMGAGGLAGSMLTVEEGIRVLSPSAVLLVGIAYGMQVKDQRMGDILVSRQLLGYELQRVGKDRSGEWDIRVRGDRPQASPRLLARVRSGLLDWTGPAVHVGLLLSGDKLVDNIDFREQLRQLEPEAIGGEMEGAGLYAAAQRKRVDWIVVKSICDWADGRKGYQKSQRQRTAAENAANFTVHVLRQGGW
jgi:nucleoside phosphorylase